MQIHMEQYLEIWRDDTTRPIGFWSFESFKSVCKCICAELELAVSMLSFNKFVTCLVHTGVRIFIWSITQLYEMVHLREISSMLDFPLFEWVCSNVVENNRKCVYTFGHKKFYVQEWKVATYLISLLARSICLGQFCL